jgi:hypothetical protein
MSITFYGQRADGSMIRIPLDHPAHMNIANGNAIALLGLLGLGDELHGEVSLPEARRAVIRARATFDRRAGEFKREPADMMRPGQARVIVAGIDDNYLRRRLADFERFLLFVAEEAAVVAYWA